MKIVFIEDKEVPWEIIDEHIRRKIIAYISDLMLVKIEFRTGGAGALHQHYHTQISQVERGVFEVEIDGIKKVFKAGDAFYIPTNVLHRLVCLEEGVLIDAFSPMRENFIK
jgi:quercetin dioxygenase-like cupin family protein